MNFVLPRNDQRVAIMGRTGTGKTVFASWLLSLAPFHKQPYVIVDYKRDRLFADIEPIEISTGEVPRWPGLYVVRPLPSDVDGVEKWMWKVWEREKVGLFFDEMYVLPDKGALRAILTQGRSKRIPVIALSQRPKWISRFVLSEADHYGVFALNHKGDRDSVGEFLPGGVVDRRFKPYHSVWYDVSQNSTFDMLPAPHMDVILQRFRDRLEPKRRMI